MIRAIIFDCFGVLTNAPWKEFLGSLPAAQQQPASDLNHALDSGFITLNEFLQKIEELTGMSPPLVEEIINPGPEKNTVLLGYIKTLGDTYKVGLLSNVSSNWISEVLLSKQEANLFSDMVLSHEVGMIKPNPKIYHLAAQRLGCEPGECVMVDDSEGNCQGAEAVGMKAIVYKNFVQFQQELSPLLSDSNK